jgi:hypothetical protein
LELPGIVFAFAVMFRGVRAYAQLPSMNARRVIVISTAVVIAFPFDQRAAKRPTRCIHD